MEKITIIRTDKTFEIGKNHCSLRIDFKTDGTDM